MLRFLDDDRNAIRQQPGETGNLDMRGCRKSSGKPAMHWRRGKFLGRIRATSTTPHKQGRAGCVWCGLVSIFDNNVLSACFLDLAEKTATKTSGYMKIRATGTLRSPQAFNS
jgi:hypothetical protein